MDKNQQIQNTNNHTDSSSQLDRFSLGFEYDRSFRDIMHDVRIRTLDDNKI